MSARDDAGRFAAALEHESRKPEYSPAIRAHVDELVELIAHRPYDAAVLLAEATRAKFSLRATIRLFRQPRLVR
ncbi:MAG TPA: hypothetical protein VE907_19645 [Gammaproteobacteria bacterium]|nr:hypothetical protein [Gammaproteobacteria bacterium]